MSKALVLLLPAPSGDSAPLLRAIQDQGYRCETATDPVERLAGLSGGDPVILLALPGSGWSPPPLASRAGSPLEGVPALHLGAPGSGAPWDEILRGEEDLPARLAVWAGWSALLRGARSTRREEPPATPAGIPGHKRLMATLVTEMKRQDRYDAPLGLVLADIDGLREINSRYGHATGDLVINAVAETLKETIRGSDMVFHYGGDTFALLLTHAGAEATRRAVQRIGALVAGQIFRGASGGAGPQPLLRVTLSFGTACLPEEGTTDPGALVEAAERSLAAWRTSRKGSSMAPGES